MWSDVVTVIGKELTDLARDRRALLAALAYAFLGPLVLYATIGKLAERAVDEPERVIAIEGEGNAPVLLSMLGDSGFSFDESATVALDIPLAYESDFAAGRPARVIVRGDSMHDAALLAALTDTLRTIDGTIRQQRTVARGVSPIALQPLRLEFHDEAALAADARALLSMLILFLILAPTLVTTSVAIDSTSGERERRSLEPLLATPVSPAALVTGKWLAVASVALAGSLLTALLAGALMERAPLAVLGLRLEGGVATVLAVVLCLLPLCLLAAALQLLIAFTAPTFKEGQTYLTLFSLVPAAVGLMAMQSGAELALPLPVLWEMAVLEAVLAGGLPGLAEVLTVCVVYATLVLLAVMAATRRLSQESLLADA